MGILRTDNIAGLGRRNAMNGSVFFSGYVDGSSADWLQIHDNLADFDMGTGDFTFECWVKAAKSSGGYAGIFGMYNYDTAGILIQLDNQGRVRLVNPGAIDQTGSTVLYGAENEMGDWHHYAVARSGTTLKAFVNGVQEISLTYSNGIDFSNGGSAVIGITDRNDYPGDYDLNGYISNLRLIKGTALYTANFTPPTQVLKEIDGTVLLCCQDSDNPTAEATGRHEIVGFRKCYHGKRYSNIATNGDLETGTTTGWTNNGCGTFEVTTDNPHSGTYSLHCVSDGNGDSVYNQLTLNTSLRYKISAYINCVGPTGTSAKAKMKIGTSLGGSQNYESQTVGYDSYKGFGKWEYVEWIGIPTNATTYVSFNESSANNVNDWYVDDLRVELWYPEEDQNILPNPNFLTGATGWSFTSGNAQDGGGNPVNEWSISSNRLNVTDTNRTNDAFATVQLFASSMKEGRYRATVDYAFGTGGFDVDIGNSRIWSITGTNIKTWELDAGSTNSSFRLVTGQTGAGYYNNVQLFRIAEPKRNNPVPPLGVDEGITFADNTRFDTLSYMVPPKGTTENRNRGRGLSIGGQNNPAVSKWIDYIQLQSGGIAQDFGEATAQCNQAGGCSSQTRGLIARGYTDPASSNVIEYVELAVTSNALDFGDLTSQRRRPAGLSNSTRGVWIAGSAEVPSGDNYADTIDYSTIASKGDAIDFGDNTGAQISHGGAICNSTRGVYSWSYSGGAAKSELEYLTIATTGSVATFGNLSRSHTYHFRGCSHSDSTRGLFAGGYNPVKNEIDYITIATTGQTASDFGDLTVARRSGSGTSNSVSAVFMGGYLPGLTNVIDKVTIQATGNAVDFGDLLNKTNENASCSDSHGGLS